MDISINFSNTTQASKESTPGTLDVTKLPHRRLKSTCTKNCVPARNPLGYVVSSATTPTYYAPALACKLRLPPSPKGYGETRVLHHI
jgi:hypothetical protein